MSNPLSVIINPPGIQYGMPGDIVSFYAVVINEGDQSAVIDLFFTFDETFQKISGWSNSPRASLAVAPKESSDEVTFDFEIPADALAGTYDYTFVVDSPEHYPQDTPINFPGQLKVLLKEQTVIRAFDPSFSIIPATNPNKPITYRLDQPLKVVVKVENRSNRVDRFRLTCPDLDDNWFKISYPASGVEGVGLFDVSALELNPNTEGEITLELRPPIDTLAGSYSPTIRLLSENNPDLILLDLIYINIPSNYQVGVELHTILGTVSRKPGKYQLVLNNQGNLIRELFFNAKSRDEDEICTYKFQPKELRLLPNMTEETILTVKPRHWWRRPLFGQSLVINFQVDVMDMQSYPLANASPQATLSWKARSWWQFLLLILLGLGLFAGTSYIIWRILNPDPLKIESFSADSPIITEGDEVTLSWRINNYKQMQKLAVVTKQPPNNDIGLNFDKNSINQLIRPSKENQNPPCSIVQEELRCNRVPTGIKNPGKYVFELQASHLQGSSLFKRTSQTDVKTAEAVEVTQRPIAEVIEFKANKRQYRKGDKVNLKWKITHPELVFKAIINLKTADNLLAMPPLNIRFKEPNGSAIKNPQVKVPCTQNFPDTQFFKCEIDILVNKVGIFSPEIVVETFNEFNRKSIKQAESKIEILPKPFQLIFFRINNRDQPPNLELKEGEKVTLSWRVEGENIQVKLDPYGNVKPSDTIQLPVITNFPSRVALQVTDKSGKQQPQEKAFIITVKPKPTPTPTPAPFPFNTINPNIPIPSPTRNPFITRP
ncbi:hypothetical protein DSM106972_013090 [Dulcicalothrix desertica PCC 7102]|uniref:Uncharacterized protein n=1 Tax=Dulcicalothrix desertica PCC 7102 TaxID=232991 RepID=A0A433VQ12_9CYAN|nr:hypothetical protein [Dulcicalothrix desertica]RUT08141.1 hypothetical protein DSM106972_013090 [Dulcicalothrix desertica PCC 7102]TWH40011.1 hypothetical protein CAL7102_09299 [Dulcicalothrix desertica PCC 7102]